MFADRLLSMTLRLRLSNLASSHRFLRQSRSICSGNAAIDSPMHYLDGQRIEPTNTDTCDRYNVIEPATGRTLCTIQGSSVQDVSTAVQSAKAAFSSWSAVSGGERARVLYKAAQIIRDNIEAIAVAEVRDTGKPIWEARFDVEGCVDLMEYNAGLARVIAGQHIDLGAGNFGYTRREPLGVIGAIGAWNYPFQMAAWKSSGAICCGNTVVYKPSPLTPITTAMLADIYTEAGLPSGVFNVIQGNGAAGQYLATDPDVAKITFTGSVNTGSKVMAACAKGIRYVLLELGGKSPLIIFSDCDLENALKGTMLANFLTQGQVCSNGTRVYVQRPIYDKFLDLLIKRVQALKLGDPMAEDTTMGAIISAQHAERILYFIDSAKEEGATVATGGERIVPEASLAGGHYITPCILTNVTDSMKVAREEIFGPVACLFPFDSEDEVIQRANDTDYGLAGGVFTSDLKRAHRVAAKLQAGAIYINNYNVYPSELPFGGFKKSGLGRENGMFNIESFTQVKSVYVEMGDVNSPI